MQYVSVVGTDNLDPLLEINGVAVLALAVRVGKTRLIDNALLQR